MMPTKARRATEWASWVALVKIRSHSRVRSRMRVETRCWQEKNIICYHRCDHLPPPRALIAIEPASEGAYPPRPPACDMPPKVADDPLPILFNEFRICPISIGSFSAPSGSEFAPPACWPPRDVRGGQLIPYKIALNIAALITRLISLPMKLSCCSLRASMECIGRRLWHRTIRLADCPGAPTCHGLDHTTESYSHTFDVSRNNRQWLWS